MATVASAMCSVILAGCAWAAAGCAAAATAQPAVPPSAVPAPAGSGANSAAFDPAAPPSATSNSVPSSSTTSKSATPKSMPSHSTPSKSAISMPSAPAAAGKGGVAIADRLPVCTLSPGNPEKLAVEPCRRAPPSTRRRAVAQTIGRMSFASGPAQVYGFRASPPASVAAPTGPIPVGGCDAGGCYDASGARHDGGVGNATLDPAGRLCNRHGVWLQCE